MKRNQLCIGLLTLLILVFMEGFAQETEPVLARVHYEFFHINDTLQPEKPTREEMVLYVGQSSTLYGSFESNRIVRDMEKQMKAADFDGNLTILSQRNNSPSSYYVQLNAQKLTHIYRSRVRTNYLLTEDYPTILWNVTDSIKLIDGYPVQQAKGGFGGRVYHVWFTTELPFRGAPWKLQGLPGLVLEAYSLDGDVRFVYAGLETEPADQQLIGLPGDAVSTTPQALERLLEAIQRNPQAAMSAQSVAQGNTNVSGNVISFAGGGNPMSGGSFDVSRIKSISIKKDLSEVSAEINNPLELINDN